MKNLSARVLVKCAFTSFVVTFATISDVSGDVLRRTGPPSLSDSGASNEIRAEISEMEIRSESLWKHAGTIDDWHHIGTANNEVDASEHNCYVLGRLLGFEAQVRGLKPRYRPDLKSRTHENAYELRVMATSMTNYALAGRHILALSQASRTISWNLDCPGKHGIPVVYADQREAAPLFRIERNGSWLRVLGDIEADFSNKLEEALKENPGVRSIALGSAGGSVREALLAGRIIRAKGLETTVWNGCYSACPLVLMGGTRRTMMSPYYDLGFHQISIGGNAIPKNSEVYAAVYLYAVAMGVDGAFVLRNMWSAPPESMNVLTADDELCKSNVFTWIQRICSSK